MSVRHTAVALATLVAAATAQAGPDGAALFAQNCAACHQPDGSGTIGLAPPLKGEHWAQLGADRGYLPTVLVHGLSGPIKVNGQPFVGNMPAFGAQFDDATIAAIATYLRSLQGAASEAPYTAADVAAARQSAGSPPQTRLRRVHVLGG
ncbi:MAG: cytochrome c [Burkholderiales bacterium]|nr:cytochrome c [Burkholderiales bacterium]